MIAAHAGFATIIPAHRGTSDHPRGCGELSSAACTFSGSSPRMRGTPNGINEGERLLRIIPAHAGNSWSVDTAPERRPDHPRACGELPDEPAIDRRDLGSSPRMRGTRYFRTRSKEYTDHPRACGELTPTICPVPIIPAHAGNPPTRNFAIPLAVGSSPRMRGTQFPGVRIIPRACGELCSQKSSDHPRACGELLMLDRATLSPIGSSPRMRGTLPSMEVVLTMKRIIPAHAGNSLQPQPLRSRTADHPRACGELAALVPPSLITSGSSPRMRGTHAPAEAGHPGIRIIPAHAGNSVTRALAQGDRSDHPRACGELCLLAMTTRAHDGSSPRMRGTHQMIAARSTVRNPDHPRACGELGCLDAPEVEILLRRIIPAHAGNSLVEPGP